jgi:hypothetical protein
MARIVFGLLTDVLRFTQLALLSHTRLAAENLFVRKQLALYVERCHHAQSDAICAEAVLPVTGAGHRHGARS